MVKNLKSFCLGLLLLPLIALSQAGDWEMDFDEDFAAASGAWTPYVLNPVSWHMADGNGFDAMGVADAEWQVDEAYTNGISGQAFNFACSGWLAAPNDGTYTISGDFTVAMWINAPPELPVNQYIFGPYRATDNQRGWSVSRQRDSASVAFAYSPNGSLPTTVHALIPGSGACDRTWHHVLYMRAGTTLSAYLDGVLVTSKTLSANPYATPADCAVGAVDGGGPTSFIGFMDDILFFKRALTQDEITRLYNETNRRGGTAW